MKKCPNESGEFCQSVQPLYLIFQIFPDPAAEYGSNLDLVPDSQHCFESDVWKLIA